MEFKQAVVTQNGRALMAKLLAGKSTQFTKIKVSSTIYPDAQLANLTALTNIKQETIAQAYGNNTATVSVVGAIENTGLSTGYYINTVGLYAMDPDKGEILYSVSSASVNGYMPPDTGVSKSGFEFKIYTEVGNATKVDLTVDPAAFATHEDIERISTLKTAYSWSSDGTDRFGKEYPNENLILVNSESPVFTSFSNSTLTSTPNVSVPEWGAINAVSYTISGGTSNIKTVYTIKPTTKVESLTMYTYSIFIKNTGESAFFISNNLATDTKLEAGEARRVVLTTTTIADDARIFQFNLSVPEGVTSASFIVWRAKIEKYHQATVYTPAPSVDYENAYPDYIGLAPGYSDKPEDYVWLPEPTKNQKKLEELIELKGQVSDIQDWIQAHS